MGWDKLYIYWKGELVGELLKPIPDMWYLGGNFKSYQSQGAAAFEKLAREINTKTVFTDYGKGEEIEYTSQSGPKAPRYSAIVLGLDKDQLFIRRVVKDNGF